MQEDKMKSGFVTIIGRPNVGKSTVMNALIDAKIAITSSRAQTTRKKMLTVYTDQRGQIIFQDTPGVMKPESRLDQFMQAETEDALKTVDLVIWVIEPSSFIGAGEREILSLLRKAKTRVLLLINKTDKAGKEKIAGTENLYRKALAEALPEKQIVLPARISARNREGIDALRQEIFDLLPEGPLYYDPEDLTDETERQIAGEFIREKCLQDLEDEIPHGIAVEIESMREGTRRDGSPIVRIEAVIICERESHKSIIIGKGGRMIRKIGSEARREIEEMLDCQVFLQLYVKVRPNWRNNPGSLREYGYFKEGRRK